MSTQNSTSVVIRLRKAADYIGIANATLGNYLNPRSKYFKPDFPKKIRLGERATGFYKHEIDLWLASQMIRAESCDGTAR